MKTLSIKANQLQLSDYAFCGIYLLAASAEKEKCAINGPIHGPGGWREWFTKMLPSGDYAGNGRELACETVKNNLAVDRTYSMVKNL